MPLTYHQRTFDLIKQTPRIAEHHRAHLDALEAYHGIKLPASVREFFMLENYAELLRGNDDGILPVDIFEQRTTALFQHDERFQIPFIRIPDNPLWRWRINRNLPHYLTLIVENQGVYQWAVMLDAGDDPPVMVRENEENMPWLPCAFNFSDFAFGRTFDWWHDENTFRLSAESEGDEHDGVLKFLYHNYEVATLNENAPRWQTCRFMAESKRISLIRQPDKNKIYWWWLFAETEDALRELCRSLWQYIDFTSPYLTFWYKGERGQEIIAEIDQELR